MNFDTDLMERQMAAALARTDNMTEDMRKESIDAVLEESWNVLMHKTEGYLRGRYLVEERSGGSIAWFNAVSLGNWMTIAEKAGVRCVPANLLGAVDATLCTIMALQGERGFKRGFENLTENLREQFYALINAVNNMKRSEILRFDCCASHQLKLTLQDKGEPDATCRGLLDTGKFMIPDFSDPRLAEAFLWYLDPVMPIWSRPWVRAMRVPGDVSPCMPMLPPSATRPVEWRFYVMNGTIRGASMYYPHMAISESEARTRYGLDASWAACETVLATMRELRIVPHHTRYENRADLDTSAVHCSIDFLVTPEGAPMLLEAGPAHLRNPNYGSHPCNFGVDEAPRGIALGGGTFTR